jgi:hypothetical protein
MSNLNGEDRSRVGSYSNAGLILENKQFGTTGGVSENNREEGFLPAFQDMATGRVYRSCFASGKPAPIHVLDGLPGELVVARDARDCAIAFKPTLVAGFLRGNRFYTREQAAQFVSEYH